MILKTIYLLNQRFIPAILMSGQKQKILNLLIQLRKSVFIKFYSKTYRNSLASSSIQNKLVSFFPLFQAIIYPPDRNSLRFFRSFLPDLPTRAPASTCCYSPTFNLGQFENSVFSQKKTLVKLLG